MKAERKGFLFDYDGVLAKTPEDNANAWQHAFKDHGIEFLPGEYFLLEGLSPIRIAEEIGRRFGLDPKKYKLIVEAKEDRYKKNNHFSLYEGIEELILRLNQNEVKLAVVSGASEERLRAVTPPKFLSLFSAIVTADKVINPKPHPEPYQKALMLLGLKSHEAVVVENAPLGIQSAKAAGIYCVAICSTLTKEHLSQADKVIDSFSDLEKILFKDE